jgi:molecular chaperone DnaK (HSP70)
LIGWDEKKDEWVVGEDVVKLFFQGCAVWPVLGRRAEGFRACRQARTEEEVLTPLFRVLREDAEVFLGRFVSSCVVALPGGFPVERREAMTRAAAAAGLDETRFLSESAALALSFDREGRFLLLDFGAEEASLFVVEGKGVVLDSAVVPVGGGDFDSALAEWLCERLGLTPPEGEAPPFWQALLWEAESLKIALSSLQSCKWRPSPEFSAQFFQSLLRSDPIQVDREDLERVARFPIRRVVNALERLWERYAPDRLFLAGGSSRIPLLRETLKKEDRLSFCAEGAAALGAALFARTGEEPTLAASPRRRLRELKLRLVPLETLLSETQVQRLRALTDQIDKLENDVPSVNVLEGVVKELETTLTVKGNADYSGLHNYARK